MPPKAKATAKPQAKAAPAMLALPAPGDANAALLANAEVAQPPNQGLPRYMDAVNEDHMLAVNDAMDKILAELGNSRSTVKTNNPKQTRRHKWEKWPSPTMVFWR